MSNTFFQWGRKIFQGGIFTPAPHGYCSDISGHVEIYQCVAYDKQALKTIASKCRIQGNQNKDGLSLSFFIYG